ncbi:hypothetical protein C1E23_16730 [Pseudoalteromonas phenolica]|uniref:DoxX-like family protein n=1 Tax=Pseudoalteromonas phenolica TaxID=161398 RepID=A0A4V2EJD4_9GAMM|nr:DoxX-like family protein [Pseudoalteromonas phenolica]RZQ51958.1 hypothetical protein C1E23_16730 [Pseudoalteromonas phenolica]
MTSIQIARYALTFSWLYHGIFPKLLYVAPYEKLLIDSFGFSEQVSYFITKSAGVSEVIFGGVIFIFYRIKSIILLNIFALFGLIIFVAVLQPQLLVEAFNPVTTNIMMIALSVILFNELQAEEQQDNRNH